MKFSQYVHGVCSNRSLTILFWRLVRFGVVGLACAFAFVLLSRFLMELCGLPVYAATGMSYLLVTPFSYAIHRGFTFRSRVAHIDSLPKYIVISSISMLVSAILPAAMNSSRWLNLDLNVALAITCCIVPMINYLIKSNWVFPTHEK